MNNIQIHRSGQAPRDNPAHEAEDRTPSAIEPIIGHMKMDGRLNRDELKWTLGDALHAVRYGVSHKILLPLKKRRLLGDQILQQF